MTKTYLDGNVLNESDLDGMKTSTETFLNTTKIDSDNIQAGGVNKDRLATAVQNALLPAGVQLPYGGTSAPAGFLLCDGSAVSRTTYADLFTAISTAYGIGDGSTTFNLPDKRGRGSFGKDDMDNTVGTGGGAANRLISSQAHGVDGTVLGASGGSNQHLLTAGESGIRVHGHADTFATDSESAHKHEGGTLSTGTESATHYHFMFEDIVKTGGAATVTPTDGVARSLATSPAAEEDYSMVAGNASLLTHGRTGTESANHTHNVVAGDTAAGTAHNHPITGSVTNAVSDSATNNHTNLPGAEIDNWIIKT